MNEANGVIRNFEQFDTVQVRVTHETAEFGLAGLTGQVCGVTVPSRSGVLRADIVGNLTEDYAVSVRFDELFREYWFARGLLNPVDQSAGSQVGAGGKAKSWAESGNWRDERNRRYKFTRFWAYALIVVVAGALFIVERIKAG